MTALLEIVAADALQTAHERDVLAEAIGKAAIKSGIASPEAILTGPFLIMLAEDMADCIIAQSAYIQELEENINLKADWIEATIGDSHADYCTFQEIRAIAETPNPAAFDQIAALATSALNNTNKK